MGRGVESGGMTKLGQVDLFTRRIRKPPPVPERATHIALADTLKWSLMPGWVWFHPPNGEKRDKSTADLLKRMGVKPGVSDFCFIAPPVGRFHALELKRKGAKPTDAQYDFMMAVAAAGGTAEWVDNYEDAVDVLRDWGAVRGSQ
jgi:hypothetical protein